MAEWKEQDLFSDDFEEKARALLADTDFLHADAKEDAESDAQSLDDINALLLSVGLSPIDNAAQPEESPAAAQSDAAATPEEPEEPQEEPQAPQTTAVVPDVPEEEPQNGEALRAAQAERTAEPSQKTRHFTPPRAKKTPAKQKEADNGQLLLDGYNEEDAPRRVNEAEVEAQLQQNRKNLVENFRVLSGDREDNAILEKAPGGETGRSQPQERRRLRGFLPLSGFRSGGKAPGKMGRKL